MKELQALPRLSRIHCVCCEAHRRCLEERLLGQTSPLLWASVSHLLVGGSLGFTELWEEAPSSV